MRVSIPSLCMTVLSLAAPEAASAASLVQEAEPMHSMAGHEVLVRLAVEAGDEALALARLDAFAAGVDPSDADGLDALGSATALAALAFPEAFPDGGPQARGTNAPELTSAGKAGETNMAAARLSAWPNPTTGAARVSVPTEAGETLSVSLYDGLGRCVAVVAEGEAAPGGTYEAALPVASLPPGIYLVRVERRGHGRAGVGRGGAVDGGPVISHQAAGRSRVE